MRTVRAFSHEAQPELVVAHGPTLDHEDLIGKRPRSVSSAHTFKWCGRRWSKRRSIVADRSVCVCLCV